MAHTRRKRRTKHRGTAVGSVEARGRTGKPAPGAGKSAGRSGSARATGRGAPSWKSAYIRGALAALFLFALTRIGLGGDMSIESSILFASLALFIYVPLGYYMDTFIYSRRQKREDAKPRR